MENQKDFCTECRRETSYTLKKIKINRTIREISILLKSRLLSATNAAAKWGIPGLLDYNMKEIDEQYRYSNILQRLECYYG